MNSEPKQATIVQNSNNLIDTLLDQSKYSFRN